MNLLTETRLALSAAIYFSRNPEEGDVDRQFEEVNHGLDDLEAERERMIDALSSCLPMLKYFHEREGCPETLGEVQAILDSCRRKAAKKPTNQLKLPKTKPTP